MRTDHDNYEVYSNNRIIHGTHIEIDHSVYYKGDCDISDLIKMSAKDVERFRDKSAANENRLYEKVLQAISEWEKEALVTQRHNKALEYLNVPSIEHTSNKWVDAKYDYKERSNMVYFMEYRIYKRQARNGALKWDVAWSVRTQRPHRQTVLSLGHQEKTYSSEEVANRYIQKRIAEYDHLFTEISPVIPDIYKPYFSVNGELLPGYTTVSMQKEIDDKKISDIKKPSVTGQLDELKNKSKTKQEQTKKKSEPEL